MDIKKIITLKINSSLSPEFIKIIDFSSQHKNHFDNKTSGDTSHMSLIIVSDNFEGLSKISRERKVHKILREEIEKYLHSIRLKLYTIKEYDLVRR
jgi:BolA protein